jgi:hypothetical protein
VCDGTCCRRHRVQSDVASKRADDDTRSLQCQREGAFAWGAMHCMTLPSSHTHRYYSGTRARQQALGERHIVKGLGVRGGGADLREVVCVCELTVAFEFLECVGKEKRVSDECGAHTEVFCPRFLMWDCLCSLQRYFGALANVGCDEWQASVASLSCCLWQVGF